MKKFHCKYCGRVMDVSALEFKSNQFCNHCFEERASANRSKDAEIGKFFFMGEEINMSDKLRIPK